MIKPRFTKNKQVVRDIQGKTIEKYFSERLGQLKYFGLPSEEMKDVIDWKPFFSRFTAVERGNPPNSFGTQHLLMLTAYKTGILSKTILLRGDIDRVVLDGKDKFGNVIGYPFDVITLDYSGGLLYRDCDDEQYRLKAIQRVIEEQARYRNDYLLFISTNLDNSKDAEIGRALGNMKTELLRSGMNGDEVIEAYLNHEKDEVRLKIYVPYFVNQIASFQNYNCSSENVIFYLGNKDVRMMNFRFFLKHDPRTTVPRFPKERLSQIFNSPVIGIENGKYKELSLGLPKLRKGEVRI